MAIGFANLGVSTVGAPAVPDFSTLNDLTSYPSASWTPPTTGLIIAYCIVANNSVTPNQPTVTGNSLTWTAITTRTATPSNIDRVTLYAANASGATTGVTTFDCAGQTEAGMRVSFFQATGVDLTGGVATAFVQSVVDSNNVPATSASLTLAAAGNSNNRPIASFYHFANEATTPRTNWTTLDDVTGASPSCGLNTQYRGDTFETTASASWTTSAGWIGIAAELKADAASTAVVLDPFGMSGFFGG